MPRENPPDFNSMTINQRIACIRKLKGYSQNDLAEIFGIKASTYSQKERKGIIDCEFLIKFCDYFNIDIRLMLYGETPKLFRPLNISRILLYCEWNRHL